ncbi:hypothetical protein [Streptomyces cirratus]|uniref:hypothetical protein n=1 Tax=Streptomyces cirratus TaxID=68187 RepID=UPI00361D003A
MGLDLRHVPAEHPLTFRVAVVDAEVTTDISHATQIISTLPGAATVIGFMMFMTTYKAREMDQRLILAGFPRTALSLARLTAMAAVAAVLATQITVLLRMAVGAPQPAVIWTAGLCAALAYGGLGTMLGALLNSELSGLFLVIAVVFAELTLQNPLNNPRADQPWLVVLPLFGPSQTATAAAFTHHDPGSGHAALGLLWCASTIAVATTALYARTRSYGPHTPPPGPFLPASRAAPPAATDTGVQPAGTHGAPSPRT